MLSDRSFELLNVADVLAGLVGVWLNKLNRNPCKPFGPFFKQSFCSRLLIGSRDSKSIL